MSKGYFGIRRTESGSATPGTPAQEQSELLTPGSRQSYLKFPRPKAQLLPKSSKVAGKDSSRPTRLQSKWINRGQNRLSSVSVESDSSSDAQNDYSFSPHYASASLALPPRHSTSSTGSHSSDTSGSSLSDRKKKKPSLIPSRSSDRLRDAAVKPVSPASPRPAYIASDAAGGEIVTASDAPGNGEAAHASVIAKDFASLSVPGLSPITRPSLARQNTSKWGERLRQRSEYPLSRNSSTNSLTALGSRQPSAALLRVPLSSSTPHIDDGINSSISLPLPSPTARKSGKSLDVDIDFTRIRSPLPFSPSASLPDLRSPLESAVKPADDEAIDARIRPRKPYGPQSSHSGSSVGSSTSSSEGVVYESESDDDYDEDLGPVPQVPAALEYIDPEIECVAPAASTATLPLAEAQLMEQAGNEHPWVTPPYNIQQRDKPVIHKWRATFKISISFGVVISLLVGYGLRVKIVKVGPWSFGMYGLLLVVDFIVQTIAASFNRRRVNKLTKASPIVAGVAGHIAAKDDPAKEAAPLPEVSIAVVGYREDEEAWIACLKSLQAQEYPIKHIIGVVDGNDGPDLAMAEAFGKAFPEDQRLISHLPVLLSVMYKEKYWEHMNSLAHPPLTRWQYFKMWLTEDARPGQQEAHEVAWNHTLNYVHMKATEERWADWKGICFSQPHGHKRHAMFTSFIVGAYALGTKDAMLTTDSDTYVYPDAVKNMMALLFSDKRLAGVTGDVRIWNKSDSFLALMSSIRYWFAFNVERACQSAFGCVGCLSGPLGLYKTSDLMSVLGPWILQSFLGKETTFGDDRHLSNRILSLGHKTGYTHLAMCDSDTPAGYVRWVKQQTRWSKSFFREAYWFPKSFAYHEFWLTVETTKQFLYPMVLTATVLHMLYKPTSWIRPVIWLATMFGVAVIKSVYGVICLRDPKQFLFGIYGFMYFFGLLPSKLFACFTVHITNWGTSARSKSEFARPESFLSRTTHVGHLVVWYLALSTGLAYLLATVFHQPFFWLVSVLGLLLSSQAYSDVIVGETKYAVYMLKKKWKARRATKVEDVEKGVVRGSKRQRLGLKKLRRGKKAAKEEVPVTSEMPPDAIVSQQVGPESTSVAQPVPDAEDVRSSTDVSSVESPVIALQQSSSSSGSSHPSIVISSPQEFVLTNFTGKRKASLSSTATTASSDNSPFTPANVEVAVEPTLSYLPMVMDALHDVKKSRKKDNRSEEGKVPPLSPINDEESPAALVM